MALKQSAPAATASSGSDAAGAAVSMSDVAGRAGVSVNTVSLVLRNSSRISAATAERVRRAAGELGYERNPIIGQLLMELRRMRQRGYRQTLAVLSAHPDADAFVRHAAIPRYLAGIERRAASAGCRLDRFWLMDPKMTPRRLKRILDARGIAGALCFGLWPGRGVVSGYRELWQEKPFVSVAVPTVHAGMSCTAPDHFSITQRAVVEAVARGYRRPALLIKSLVDRIVAQRYSAGFRVGVEALPVEQRVPWLHDGQDAILERAGFLRWFEQNRPDVLITYDPVLRTWVEESGRRVPDEVGIILLERVPGCEAWAHFDQCGERLGELATDLLLTLLGRGETGTHETAHTVMLPARWVPGITMRAG